ncbi:hypothetical protein FA13DRAFT_1766337 [Coprinellus micaceus]|uniref:SigF-like NTF2-like domain-containing protein n=1 Tax=Coprinellus micaceus TaxID=71717 RepID=A0A4Y7SMU2_COPMI|nr:hypothetical protein FA13DRAFT_1766337 [Coprinellus micaceus]
MEDPEQDIASVIFGLTTVASPDLQRETVETYMTKDVAFEHPVCSVQSGPNSREKVLKVYQWYRILSPQLDLKVEHVVFDTKRDIMYVEIVQWFKLFFLPAKPLPARLVTRLELQKIRGLYYISRQDDFYHTTEFARLVTPPIGPLVAFLLWLGGIVSYALALAAQVAFGVWQPTADLVNGSGRGGEGGNYPGDHDELYETPATSPDDRKDG